MRAAQFNAVLRALYNFVALYLWQSATWFLGSKIFICGRLASGNSQDVG
jgi:hypothetical protein